MPEKSALHQAALAYANAGIPVFPCLVGGKAPAVEGGFYAATDDISQIDQWWSEADYNIGVCPEDAGWAIIDLDTDHSEIELPETHVVETPSGGFHHYFQGSVPSTVAKLGEHIDTRGQRGYVLVPPSLIDGQAYRILHARPFATLPHWITDRLQRPDRAIAAATSEPDLPGNVARARNLLHDCVRRNDIAVSGQGGDDRTYRLACELLDLGISPNTACELLEEIWNPHCRPAWQHDELVQKLEHASRYRENDVGAYAVAPAVEVFKDAVASVPEKRGRFYAEDEDEQEQGKDPTWLIKNLIAESSTVLLIGPTQSYKSFLALDIALSIAANQETFTSRPTSTGFSFYAALEGRANIKKARRRAWKGGHLVEGKIENFYVMPAPIIGMPGEVEEFGNEIQRRCGQQKPKLIVLDTLSKCMAGLNENDAMDAGKFIRFCDSLVEAFGCSVIAIHHTGKDDARGARGSSAFHAGFDTVLEVKAHRQSKAVSVHVRKHKDAEERETPWTFEGRVFGQSLCFFPTDAAAHRQLTHADDFFDPRKIGAALQALDAFGREKSVSTAVLAAQLTPAIQGEEHDARAIAIGRTARSLSTLSRGKLAGYCERLTRGVAWFLPAPKEKAGPERPAQV